MTRSHASALGAGLVGGTLLFVHGLFPNTHAYPLVWPLLAGAVAAWRGADPAREHRVRRGVLAAVVAGAVAGALAFGAFTLALLALAQPSFAPIARALGASGPLPFTPAAVQALALVTALAVPAALIGGVLASPLPHRGRG